MDFCDLRLNSQHNLDYAHLTRMSIFTLTMNKISIRAPNFTREMAKALIWIFQSSRTNCVSYILKVGYMEKNVHLGPCI